MVRYSSAIIVKVRNVDLETLVIRTSFSISSISSIIKDLSLPSKINVNIDNIVYIWLDDGKNLQ